MDVETNTSKNPIERGTRKYSVKILMFNTRLDGIGSVVHKRGTGSRT